MPNTPSITGGMECHELTECCDCCPTGLEVVEDLRLALAEACDEIENMVNSADETTTGWRALIAKHKPEVGSNS